MKRIVFTTALLFAFFNGFTQDADLDKFFFNTQSVWFPKNIVPADKRTYTVGGRNGTGVDLKLQEEVKLNGFAKTEQGVVKVTVAYSFPISYSPQQLLTKPNPYTNGALLYSFSFTASCDGRITIECPELDYKKYELVNFRKTYGTKDYNSNREATDSFAILSSFWMADAKVQFQQYVVSQANFMANIAFGYPGRKSKVKLWLLGSKDNPEYEHYQQYYKIIKENFAQVTFDSIPPVVIANLLPAIEYFQSVPKLFPADSKKDRKIRYSAYYTLMKIYYHLDDLAKAEAYANLLIANDFDKKDGKNMLDDIKEKKESWEKNKAASSHFHISNDTGAYIYNTEY